MLRKNATILLILFLQTVLMVAQSSRFKDDETIHVWASSGLNMRSKPDAKAEKIATIPYGAKVVVLPNIGVNIPFEVEEFKGFVVKGYWLLVKYENTEGFVFDGFLSRLHIPTTPKNDTLGIEGYLAKYVGKVGEKYDRVIYDNKPQATVRNASSKEKVKDDDIRDFSQKYNYDLQYDYDATESTSGYSISSSELTLYEIYILVKTFYYTKEDSTIKFDKTEKAIIINADCGCSSSIKKIGKKIVASGGCGC
jgi:Bacterial SH3 domain